MDADRARIRELAESARRLPVAERKAFLDGFRLDAAVRREVESLLAAAVPRMWKPAAGAAAAEAPTEVPVAGDAGERDRPVRPE
ncbi:MAG: hypothetical protein ACKOEL_11155, partial [Planctomycetota bacterium]